MKTKKRLKLINKSTLALEDRGMQLLRHINAGNSGIGKLHDHFGAVAAELIENQVTMQHQLNILANEVRKCKPSKK